jgi:hypothetical protein
MKAWQIILIVVAAIILTIVACWLVNRAKLKKAATAGKITISKQDYTLVKVVKSLDMPATLPAGGTAGTASTISSTTPVSTTTTAKVIS